MDRKSVTLDGQGIAYVWPGSGCPNVFLHGNPVLSDLWRDEMPQVQQLGRCIAPDRVGIGDSAKLPNTAPDTATPN